MADITPMGASFEVQKVSPRSIALVPVLRSGLGMVEGLCFSSFPHFCFLFQPCTNIEMDTDLEKQLSRLSSLSRSLSTILDCSVR